MSARLGYWSLGLAALTGAVLFARPTPGLAVQRPRLQCPVLAVGLAGMTCYPPHRLRAAEARLPLRPLDPGYHVWRATGRRVRSIIIENSVEPPPTYGVAIFFLSGRVRGPGLGTPRCSSRPKFVLVGEHLNDHRNRGIRTIWGHGCWEFAANWTRDHVSLSVLGNYPRDLIRRTGLSVFRAGLRPGM